MQDVIKNSTSNLVCAGRLTLLADGAQVATLVTVDLIHVHGGAVDGLGHLAAGSTGQTWNINACMNECMKAGANKCSSKNSRWWCVLNALCNLQTAGLLGFVQDQLRHASVLSSQGFTSGNPGVRPRPARGFH
jgi:hypothetical protein